MARASAAGGCLSWALSAALFLGGPDGFGVQRILAQVYDFSETPVPERKSLQALYKFYIYAKHDAPSKKGQPSIRFSGVATNISSDVTVALMPFDSFWEMIDPQKFCATADDVKNGEAAKIDDFVIKKPKDQSHADVDVYMYRVSTLPKDVAVSVKTTGVYVLVLTNCGDSEAIEIEGSVKVKNNYGFLPANMYYKMPFNMLTGIVYVVLIVFWLALSVQWKCIGGGFVHAHHCIAGICLLSVVEAGLWWYFLKEWNTSGVWEKYLFTTSLLSSVMKRIFAYVVLLVTSMGWGVTKPDVSMCTFIKVQVLTFLYSVFSFMFQSVLFFRTSHNVSPKILLAAFVPTLLINAALFIWVLRNFGVSLRALPEDAGSLFRSMRMIVVLGVLITAIAQICHAVILTDAVALPWASEWFVPDGTSEIVFILGLVCMMGIWAPQRNFHESSYTLKQVENDEGEQDAALPEPPANAFAVGGDEDDDEAALADKSKKTAVAPNTIGATDVLN